MPSLAKSLLVTVFALSALAGVGYAQDNSFRRGLAEFGPDGDMIRAAAATLYEDENVSVGNVEAWSNPETGGEGTVEVVEIFEYQGLPCRKLLHRAKLSTSRDVRQIVISRCRTAEGEWKIL
ncbi:MAG: RT0821/Lpp0805 family surface protein [Geminicoccaceae bacterium]